MAKRQGFGTVSLAGVLAAALVCWPAGATSGADPSEAGPRTIASPLQVRPHRVDETTARVVLDSAAYTALKSQDRVTFSQFPLGAVRRADLELERFDIFTGDAILVIGTDEGDVPMARPDVILFRGQVASQPDSSVFLSLSPYGSHGLIRMGGETFVVSSRTAANVVDTVVYDLDRVGQDKIQWRDWTCDADRIWQPNLPLRQAARVPRGAPGSVSSSATVTREVEVAVETDWEFTASLFGGSTASASAYIATLMGAVSEIYEEQVEVRLAVSFSRVWTTSSDPWNQTNTGDQLNQFRSYWNSNMTGVQRDLAHFLSGRSLGGGVAWVGVICNSSFGYGLSAIDGHFPYPLQDNHPQNWDIVVVAHEVGHNHGAPHTHNMSPPIDNCAGGNCSVTPNGTIMSYCHLCPGGLSNILLEFHSRIKNERILPYLASVGCDLFVEPPDCPAISAPTSGAALRPSRYLSIAGGGSELSALRVVLRDLPPPYEIWNDQAMWIGPPENVSENSSVIDPDGAPMSPTFLASTLQCDPYYTNWSALGTVHVRHEAVVPDGLYEIQAVQAGCPTTNDANFSAPLFVVSAEWGDLVGALVDGAWTSSDGSIDIATDVLAVFDKFSNRPTAPPKVVADVEPAMPDMLIDITDALRVLDAFRGLDYPFPPGSTPCP